MSQRQSTLDERRRNDWLRLISRLLERATTDQLRGIYLLLCGYLGDDDE